MNKIYAYKCERCGKIYYSEAECERCELNHLMVDGAEPGAFKPMKKYPESVSVQFSDGTAVEYTISTSYRETHVNTRFGPMASREPIEHE